MELNNHNNWGRWNKIITRYFLLCIDDKWMKKVPKIPWSSSFGYHFLFSGDLKINQYHVFIHADITLFLFLLLLYISSRLSKLVLILWVNNYSLCGNYPAVSIG